MAWDVTVPAIANNISADIPQIDAKLDWLTTELAKEKDFVVGSNYRGELLGGAARPFNRAVAYSDAGQTAFGVQVRGDAAQAGPYSDRRLLIDSVGRQFYYDDTGVVWKPLCSNRISRTDSNAASTSGVLVGSPTWVDWDAANLDITKTIDDDASDWIEKCEFNGTFQADGASLLEVRIYDNTNGVVVGAGQGMAGASGDRIDIHILAYYQAATPAGGVATTFKIQVSGSAGRTFVRSSFATTATYLYHHFSVSEVPAP